MDKSGKILVVGASGFIGRAVLDQMVDRGFSGVAVSRHSNGTVRAPVQEVIVRRYDDPDAIAAVAEDCTAAIMLAGRAHVLKENAHDPAAAFFQANRDIPLTVAEAFASAGGRRFVFLSSIAVNGIPGPGQALREDDVPDPVNAYGRSKLSGEQALVDRCRSLGLELVIVRAPLVYGPEAPGNFGQLLRAAKRGVPLPLASIRNRRDLIGSVNLADLLLLCARHPAAAGQLFMASDGEPLSTSMISGVLYRASGWESRLLPAPTWLLRTAARLFGKMDAAARLLDDLRIDSSHVRATLGWHPPMGATEGLRRSVVDERR